MRVTKEQVLENRERIIDAASRLFQAHGLERVSVADVMSEAGFTHGGFYNHFGSKEELAAEAISRSFQNMTGELTETIGAADDPGAAFVRAVKKYLTLEHRDAPGGGCPTAALPVDAARHGEDVQAAYAKGIEIYLKIFMDWIGGSRSAARKEAVVLLSGMVGALIMSRSVKAASPELSQELLQEAQRWIVRSLMKKMAKS